MGFLLAYRTIGSVSYRIIEIVKGYKSPMGNSLYKQKRKTRTYYSTSKAKQSEVNTYQTPQSLNPDIDESTTSTIVISIED